MKSKLFEVRDRATCMGVIATELSGESFEEILMLRKEGFGEDFTTVLVYFFANEQSSTDMYSWNDRTKHVAHKYITENWGDLKSGDVIDVEFILKERPEKKKPEYLEYL